MATLYKFGDATIDLEKLAAVGPARDSGSYGLAFVHLTFIGDSDTEVYFGSGQFGLPLYVRKTKGYRESMETDSDFFIALKAEVEKLTTAWAKVGRK